MEELNLKQDKPLGGLDGVAGPFVDEEKGVCNVEEALQGASDIIAEIVADSAEVRKSLRQLMQKKAVVHGAAASEEDSVYRTYYEFEQPLQKLQGHQVLALNRGDKANFLKVSVDIEKELPLALLEQAFVKAGSTASELVQAPVEDSYLQLLHPSMDRSLRTA